MRSLTEQQKKEREDLNRQQKEQKIKQKHEEISNTLYQFLEDLPRIDNYHKLQFIKMRCDNLHNGRNKPKEYCSFKRRQQYLRHLELKKTKEGQN